MTIEFPKLIPRQLPPNTKKISNAESYKKHIEQLKEAGFELYGALNGDSAETREYARLQAELIKRKGWDCEITAVDDVVSVWQRDPNKLPPVIQNLIQKGVLKELKNE